MKPNQMQKALKENGVAVGHMVSEFTTRGIAKILESCGIDFVVVDMEHTGAGSDRVADLMAWFKATPIAPFVRVPVPQYHFIARTMDAGALGIMVPNVQSAAQAKSVVEAVKYAPWGRRGVALGTAHTDYVSPDPVAYFEEANRNTTVICQIESPAGLEDLDRIAATDGVDVLWVGHFDLSQSMGIPAQFDHPDFLAALKRVADTAKAHGKAAGIQPGNRAMAARWIELGYNVISWSADMAVYRHALASDVAWLREQLSRP